MTSDADRARRRIAIATLYGILCHGLFAAGVGAMIVMMFFGMSRSYGTLSTPWNGVANILLLGQFPFLHSFLLTRRGHAILRRLAPMRLGADLSTTTYAMIASIQVLLLFTLWSPSGIVWWRAQGPVLAVVCCLYASAWLLLLKAIVDAGLALQVGLLGWRAAAANTPPVFPPMPRSGLFRLCRQPIYVAFALTLWTVPTWTPDQLAVAVVLTAYCLIGPLFKEARFSRRFGGAFEAYRQRVPYWLPWPRPTPVAAPERRPGRPRNDLSIYDTYASVWWNGGTRWLRALRNMVPARLAYFDTLVGDWRGLQILDIGCGGGFMAEAMARRGAIVLGVDPSGPAIAAAKRHAATGGLVIDYRVGTGERLPAPNRSMDVVVCVDVLEHVDDVGRVLAEVGRVLKPGGLFLFDTINRSRLAALVIVHMGEALLRLLPRGTHDPARFIKPSELRQKLAAAGLTTGAVVGFGPRGLDRRLDFTFGRLPSAAIMYLGHAQRSADPGVPAVGLSSARTGSLADAPSPVATA